MLDPADPALLYPMFPEVLGELEQSGGLSVFRRLGNHALIALDGSEYFRPNKISCAHCSTRLRGKDKGKDKATGETEYFHAIACPCEGGGWVRHWWRQAITRSCRWSRSSSRRKTAP
jgi:hypothetical protein